MVKFDKSLLNHQSSTFWSHANQAIDYVEDTYQMIGDLRKNENAGFHHSGSLLVDVEDSSQNVNNWGLSAGKL